MKNIFSLIVSIIIATTVFSQPYHPLLSDSTQWNVLYSFWSSISTTVYHTKEKVVLNNKVFWKLTSRGYNTNQTFSVGYLREDTVLQQVYFTSDLSQPENLWYDFSLKQKDSVYLTFKNSNGWCFSTTGWYYVDTTFYTQIAGGNRKRIELSNHPSCSHKIVWIESVGCSSSLSYLDEIYDPDAGSYLLCNYQNGSMNYKTDSYSCYESNVGIEEDRVSSQYFGLSTNPIKEELYLHFTEPWNGSVLLYNALGTKIKEQVIVGENLLTINMNDLPIGMYIIRLSNHAQQTAYKKIVKL